MTRLALVIPCHRRYAITRIGFEQKATLRDELAKRGIDLEVIAVIDTADLEEHPNRAAADHYGFHVEPCDNTVLGKRWNAGYIAAAEMGFDVAMPCGSDSWLHPALFRRMPDEYEVVVTQRYSVVEPRGNWRADMWLPYVGLMFPLALAEPLEFEACEPRIARGCDTATMRRLCDDCAGHMVSIDDPPLAYVAFHGAKQITDISKLARRARATIDARPFDLLRVMYPDYLVDKIEGFYAEQRTRNTRTRAERRQRWTIPAS